MGDKSKIEWTDATWNTVYGCTHVSEGCRNCYAERLAPKMGVDFSKVTYRLDRLIIPIRWKKPRRIFVNSLSDTFHTDVPDRFIMDMWKVMESSKRHTFQILTKRPERMKGFCLTWGCPDNVWLGVSVEDQQTADERIPILLQTRAAVRFVSYEPALGPVNFRAIGPEYEKCDPLNGVRFDPGFHGKNYGYPKIHWIIVGGESGPGARPMHPDWARFTRHQCQGAGVAFFMKQMTKKAPIPKDLFIREFPNA